MINIITYINIYPKPPKYHNDHASILQKNLEFISNICHFKPPINMHIKINKRFSRGGKLWKLYQMVEQHSISILYKYEILILSENCVLSRVQNIIRNKFLLKNSSEFSKYLKNLH